MLHDFKIKQLEPKRADFMKGHLKQVYGAYLSTIY
jgi:hypothetical protein